MNVTEVVEKILQLFGSMGPDHECFTHVMESTYWLVGHPAECCLKVFGNDR